MCSLANVSESVSPGCVGGDRSAGCFEQNSSWLVQPKMAAVAGLQSKKPLVVQQDDCVTIRIIKGLIAVLRGLQSLVLSIDVGS